MSEFLGSLHPVLVCFIVCAAKIIEITIQSLKTCMMVKGQRLKAAGLGLIECTIWGLVISTIIGTLGNNLFLQLECRMITADNNFLHDNFPHKY